MLISTRTYTLEQIAFRNRTNAVLEKLIEMIDKKLLWI